MLAREGSPLRTFTLNYNPLTIDAFQALAEALPSASCLQALHLNHTSMSSQGAAFLAPALTTLAPTLQSLSIRIQLMWDQQGGCCLGPGSAGIDKADLPSIRLQCRL